MYPVRLVLLAVAFGASSWAQGDSPFVGGVWAGNVTPTSATVSIRFYQPDQRIRLQVSTSESLVPAVFSPAITTSGNNGNTTKLTVQGLVPDTPYYYGIEVGGVLRSETPSRGRFRTFPLGQASFRIAFGSCGDFRAADQSAFPAIIAEKPLLFIHMGDLHYSDTNGTEAEYYRYNYDNVLGHVAQGPFFRSMPVAYTWDDHDFAGNDSNSTSVGRDTARVVYKERVPHYPLGAAGGTVAQAFTVGRVRFIMTDLRSAASPPAQKDTASKTKLGTAQKTWFKQELISARDNGFPLIIWVCSNPWIAPPNAGDDHWGGYTTERTEIANFLRDNRIFNLAIIAGDMHALAYDDGTHSDYATGGGAPITVLQAAALTQEGSIKGGPYSGGVIPGSPHYGILEIFDSGGPSVACRFLGTKAGGGRLLTHIFSGSASGFAGHSIVNISTLAHTNGADAIISGFVISGAREHSVMVRAIGPALSAFGVNDAIAQPMLSVYKGDEVIASNSSWAGGDGNGAAAMTEAFDRVGAFRLVDEGSADAALVLSVGAGAYTVQVRSGDGTPGAALLEVYELP